MGVSLLSMYGLHVEWFRATQRASWLIRLSEQSVITPFEQIQHFNTVTHYCVSLMEEFCDLAPTHRLFSGIQLF